MTKFKCLSCLLIALCLAVSVPGTLAANDPPLVDTIYLKNGGVLQGTAKKVKENKQEFWLITTTDGSMMKLKLRQVDRVSSPTNAMREYIERKNAMPDTVDAHWEMQQWCLDNKRDDPLLLQRREYHLLRIIQLDPDHSDARARLDHKDIDGVWVHYDHFMLNHGYVRDGRGVQRLPKAIAMKERKDAADQIVKQWNKKIKNLLTRIRKRNDAAAKHEFENIKDPAAVPALMKVYQDDKNINDEMRKKIIDILGQIEAGPSQNALVVIASSDASLDLAERAVSRLQQEHFNRDSIVGTVVHWLRPGPSSKVSSNMRVNRAAWLIGRLEYTGATKPLIDALVTTHMVPTGAASGNMSVGQGTGGQGMQMGGKQPKFVAREFKNKSVLDTLRLITPGGVDFDFDENAWLDWYIRQNTMSTYQIGRDQ